MLSDNQTCVPGGILQSCFPNDETGPITHKRVDHKDRILTQKNFDHHHKKMEICLGTNKNCLRILFPENPEESLSAIRQTISLIDHCGEQQTRNILSNQEQDRTSVRLLMDQLNTTNLQYGDEEEDHSVQLITTVKTDEQNVQVEQSINTAHSRRILDGEVVDRIDSLVKAFEEFVRLCKKSSKKTKLFTEVAQFYKQLLESSQVIALQFLNSVDQRKATLEDRFRCTFTTKAYGELLSSELKEVQFLTKEIAARTKIAQKELSSLSQSHENNRVRLADLHEIHGLQLARLREQLHIDVDKNNLLQDATMRIAGMLCSKNTVWVLDQLYSLDAKWIVTCNHCVLVSRKLLTELFDRFAACSEGAKHLTEFLQLLLSYSAERLDSLTDQLTSTEHYLRPIYAADYSHNDAHYTSKCEEQFTKLRDSAKQTHEELKNVWNVKRSTILNAIGLHADEYAAYRSEEQVFGRSHHISDESSGLAAPPPRQGALSAVLRLNCNSRNVAQPKFYHNLLQNTQELVDLGELKQLLKLACDEFLALMELFRSVLFLSSPSELLTESDRSQLDFQRNAITALSDICKEISDILSEQESRLLQLLDLTDTGLITFIHLIDQFLLDLNCGRDNGSRLYPTLDQYEKKIGTWKNILPIKRNKTEHLKNQQGTASPDGRDPLVNLQTNLFQRLSDLNFVLAHCIRVQEQRMVLCDQSAIGWITRSLVHFCVRPEWIVKLQEQKCESDEISSVASTPSPGSTSNIITEIGMDDVESEELSPNRELDRTAPASQELEPQLDPVMMRQYQSRYERILRDFDSRVLLFALAKDITEIQTVVDRIVSHFNTEASNKQTMKVDCQMAFETLQETATKFTGAWQSLYDELVLVIQHDSTETAPTQRSPIGVSSTSELRVSFDADVVREDNESQYICQNSIDLLERRKRSNELRARLAQERQRKLAEEKERVEQVNQALEQDLKTICDELDAVRLVSLTQPNALT